MYFCPGNIASGKSYPILNDIQAHFHFSLICTLRGDQDSVLEFEGIYFIEKSPFIEMRRNCELENRS